MYAAVFRGTVEEITEPSSQVDVRAPLVFPKRHVRIKVDEAFVGLEPGTSEVTVETGVGGGDCGYPFERGVEYVVYARQASGGLFETGICSPTKQTTNAAVDLKYFHSLDQASEAGELRVTAYDVLRQWRTGIPALAGVAITIDGPGIHQSAVTDANGRHVFSGLPPGQYRMSGLLAGYTISGQTYPVQLHAKGCFEAGLPMQFDRVLSGRVTSSDGLPAARIQVEIVPVRPRFSNDVPSAVDSALTDADGKYELRHLTNGDFYLGVSISRAATFGQPYKRWFYPGTADPAGATILHITERAESQQMDFSLPERQQERLIEGTVYWPDGRVAPRARIFLEDPRCPWDVLTNTTVADQNGRFLIYVLDGSDYRVQVTGFDHGLFSAAPVAIPASKEALNLKFVLTTKGPSPPEAGQALEYWRADLGLR